VYVPEPLVGYACNLKGCCCGGWRIPFKPDDIVRLARSLPSELHSEGIADGLIIVTDDDHRTIDHLRLEGVGEDEHCRWLAEDGRCGIQLEYGTEALPDLCIEFPAFPFVLGERFEVHHQLICPEVVNALAAAGGPWRAVRIDPPYPEAVGLRLLRGSTMLAPQPLLGEDVGWDVLLAVRGALLEALANEALPALETLAAIGHALARLAWPGADPCQISVSSEGLDRDAWVRFLFDATNAYQADVVHTFFWRARRFMFDHEYEDADCLGALEAHLSDWQPALLRWVEPVEPLLRPLLLRFAAQRVWQAPTVAVGDLRESLGLVPLVVAMALRVTAALSACLQAPADVRALNVGLTTAEYAYRNTRYPSSGFPWFSLQAP